MPKWIVTGGAGFIGANAARLLADHDVESVIVDNLSRRSAPLNVEWLQRTCGRAVTLLRVDLRDRETIDAIFTEHANADAVLHLAGQVAVTTSVASPAADFEANIVGSFNVLEATRRHAPDAVFLNVSTNKVYGQLESHRVEETETRYVDADFPSGVPETLPLAPTSPYACSKTAADLYALGYARVYGLRTLSLRQSCIYGPRQFGVEDQGWVAWLAIAAHLGRPITIFGTGKQTRDLLYVDDLVDLYLRAVERVDAATGRAYNIGGGPANTLSLLELLARLSPASVQHDAPRPGDQKVFVADTSLAAADFDWRPATGIEAGLERLGEWVADHAEQAASILPPA